MFKSLNFAKLIKKHLYFGKKMEKEGKSVIEHAGFKGRCWTHFLDAWKIDPVFVLIWVVCVLDHVFDLKETLSIHKNSKLIIRKKLRKKLASNIYPILALTLLGVNIGHPFLIILGLVTIAQK